MASVMLIFYPVNHAAGPFLVELALALFWVTMVVDFLRAFRGGSTFVPTLLAFFALFAHWA